MAVLLPTTLPSVLEYNNFVSTHNFYTDAIFFTSIAVTVTAVTVNVRNTSNLLIVVGNANQFGATTGTFLGIGNSIRISGYHFGNFDYENWKYRKTKPDDTQYSVASYSLLPGQYFSLWNFTADVRTTTTISISVQTSAGNFTLTQTLYNNWDVGRDNMKRLVYLSDINRYTSSVLATSSLTYLSGIGLVAPILSFDGTSSSLNTWINRGATIDSTTGLTAVPSIKVIGTTYAYTSVAIGSFLDKTITFNVNLTSGGTQLANLFFATDSSGAGPMLRLDARSANSSGFMRALSWTSWTSEPTTGITITPGIWHKIAINISSSNVATWYLDNVKQTTSLLTIRGTNLAIHGDGATVLGGNFDDLTIWQNITREESSAGGGVSSGSGTTAFTFTASINTSVQNYNIKTAAIAAGWDQILPLSATVTIAAGTYVWSDTTGTAGLATGTTFPANTVINIINNGFIIGKGGKGGGQNQLAATQGGPALSLGYNINLTNNGYVAGGGGGGGFALNGNQPIIITGGGGAGGGEGGGGAAGGALNQPGVTGVTAGTLIGGGGGGRILPGAASPGGALPGAGGEAGGAGAGYASSGFVGVGGIGGGGSTVGGAGSGGAGGGGGWGAAGGNATYSNGAAGGKAIELNGNTVTYISTGTIYGVVA